MTGDQVFWLVAGAGLGLGLAVIVLVAYATLEHRRLGRRLAAARAAPIGAVEERGDPAPVSEPALPAAVARPEVLPQPGEAAAPAPTKPEAVPPAEAVAPAQPAPAIQKPAAPTRPVAAPSKPQSVEEIFAEAFANDRLAGPQDPARRDGETS